MEFAAPFAANRAEGSALVLRGIVADALSRAAKRVVDDQNELSYSLDLKCESRRDGAEGGIIPGKQLILLWFQHLG